ncbi:MAG: YaaR family protein [Bacillota bacterium]
MPRIKVDNNTQKNVNTKVGQTKGSDKSSEAEKSFLNELKQVHGEKIKAKLDELLSMIDQQGDKLAEHRTFNELLKYKNMVKNFVEEAIEKMYQVKDDYSPTQGKVQSIVKSVDSSLEELTTMIVEDQEAQLNILDQLDEVRGMLIDLYR